MAVPKNKEELLKAIQTDYNKLKNDLTAIPQSLTYNKELPGHAKNTEISVCNLISYLIGWGTLVLTWEAKKRKQQHVDFPETGYKWNQLGLLAQKFYNDYEHKTYAELLFLLEKNHVAILSMVTSYSNEELYHTAWYDKWSLGKMIQLNTSSPYKNARSRIRKWKKETGV